MKVGFFDSGLGGLTIFKEALKRIKLEYMYLGDNKNAPYGVKEKEVVKKYIFNNVDFLIKNGCNIIVVACNTATSIAINDLRNKYPNICIIGTEPAVKKAVESNNVKRVLVCATSITVKEGKLKKLVERLNVKEIVDVISLDKLVEFAEEGNINLLEKKVNKEIIRYLEESLNNYNLSDYSHVVLGCTHFPLFKKEFEFTFGKKVSIVDGSVGVVNNLERKIDVLSENNQNTKCREKAKQSNIQLVMTEESDVFLNKFKKITHLENFEVIIK